MCKLGADDNPVIDIPPWMPIKGVRGLYPRYGQRYGAVGQCGASCGRRLPRQRWRTFWPDLELEARSGERRDRTRPDHVASRALTHAKKYQTEELS